MLSHDLVRNVGCQCVVELRSSAADPEAVPLQDILSRVAGESAGGAGAGGSWEALLRADRAWEALRSMPQGGPALPPCPL